MKAVLFPPLLRGSQKFGAVIQEIEQHFATAPIPSSSYPSPWFILTTPHMDSLYHLPPKWILPPTDSTNCASSCAGLKKGETVRQLCDLIPLELWKDFGICLALDPPTCTKIWNLTGVQVFERLLVANLSI